MTNSTFLAPPPPPPPPPPPAEGVLLVCTSCPRAGESPLAVVHPGAGSELASDLAADLQRRGIGVHVATVDCLSRCGSACNVRLVARRKVAYELQGLMVSNVADLADLVGVYVQSADGVLTDAEIPPAIRDKILRRGGASLR